MGKNLTKNDFIKKKNKEEDLGFEALSIEQKIPLEKLKENFPTLYQEINQGIMKLNIDEQKIRDNDLEREANSLSDPFANYEPDIFDYLARARTESEGNELVDFFENQKKISSEFAAKIKKKINRDGIRSFGPWRGPNYYFQKAGEISTKRAIKKRYSLSGDLDETE
jgi:hypothetical protein